MANQGKRMVPEYLIKKIGEGGGGTEYTAGTGIDITNNEISVDTETIATKEYVDEHGGSVDIDNKTIVKNADDELETAIGGWKETVQLPYNPVLVGTGSDWDLIGPTLATNMFNALEVDTKYNVTLNFTDTTVPLQIKEAYIQTSSKTSTKFGGGESLTIIDSNDDTHLWEFYIDLDQSSGRIHVWPSDSWVSPDQDSTLSITFNPVEVYHQIDSKYIPLEFNGNYEVLGEEVSQFKFGDNVYYIKPIAGNGGAGYGSPNLQNIQIGSNQFVVSDVHANTSETVTGGALTDIKIDGYVYSVGGGSTPSNMVTTDTTQTITGTKTISNVEINFENPVQTGNFYMNSTAQSTTFKNVNPYNSSRVSSLQLSTSSGNPTILSAYEALILSASTYMTLEAGNNSVSVADLAALITYAKAQGWIQ